MTSIAEKNIFYQKSQPCFLASKKSQFEVKVIFQTKCALCDRCGGKRFLFL